MFVNNVSVYIPFCYYSQYPLFLNSLPPQIGPKTPEFLTFLIALALNELPHPLQCSPFYSLRASLVLNQVCVRVYFCDQVESS